VNKVVLNYVNALFGFIVYNSVIIAQVWSTVLTKCVVSIELNVNPSSPSGHSIYH